MPFIVKHQSPADVLTLASAAGYQQGRAEHWARQQQLDARISEMAVQASMMRNAEPGFFERMSGGTYGLGAGVRPPEQTAPASPGAPPGQVQTYDRFGRVGDPHAGQARTIAALQERAAAEQKREDQQRQAERMGAGGGPTRPEGPAAPQTYQPEITGEEGMAGERRGARMIEQGRIEEFVNLATRRSGDPRRTPTGAMVQAPRSKDAVDALSAFYSQMPTIPVPDLRVYREKFAARGMAQTVQDIDQEIQERQIANMIAQVPQDTKAVLNTWKQGVDQIRELAGREPTPDDLLTAMEGAVNAVTAGDPEKESTLLQLLMSDHPTLIQYRQHLVDPNVPNPFDPEGQQQPRQPQGGVSGQHPEPQLQPGNTVQVNRQQGGQ